MKYIALDFEAGNRLCISACSIGLAYYEDDRLIERQSFLIQPPAEAGKFDWCAVKIHGIKRAQLVNEPTFPEIWKQIAPRFEGAVLVCHNAAYDTRVLCECLAHYGLPRPQCSYLCTVVLSRKVWPDLGRYRLNLMAERLQLQLNHHEASSDAYACGEILQHALRLSGCRDAVQLLDKYQLPLLQLQDIAFSPQDITHTKDKNKQKQRRRSASQAGAVRKPQNNTADPAKTRVTVTTAKPRKTPQTKQVKPTKIGNPKT